MFEIREACIDDAGLLARYRARLHAELRGRSDADVDAAVDAWLPHFQAMMHEGILRGWFAFEQKRCVGSVALLVRPSLPSLKRGATYREGRIQSMLVEREFRGRGIGRALAEAALTWARASGLFRMTLAPSEISGEFYAKLGFVPLGDLVLNLDPATPETVPVAADSC